MTDEPTDEALENLFVEETGFDIDDFPAAIFDFARAVLAKWGQPAQAAEPVAWAATSEDGVVEALGMNQSRRFDTPLYLAPQSVVLEPLTPEQIAEMMRDTWGCASIAPRHALAFARAVERAHGITQAGAVPLTCEWTHNEDDGFWETACGEAWRFDDGGPGENNMHFCHSCGNSLRIKGGQHGTE